MAGVVLAECHGQVWLVGGDEHIDAVLHGKVPDGVTVEYVAVANRAAVIDMWTELSPEADEGGMPWMINPSLLARLRGSFAPGIRTVHFTPWSVLLDVSAGEALTAAAAWLQAEDSRRLRLRQFAPDPALPGLADLQRLRAQLAVAALARAGADTGRVVEETAPAAAAADAERMEVIEEAAST